MLGLPPAFVLSQDQTLKLKSNCLLNLDVRTSAHQMVVQTIHLSVCCASVTKVTRSRPNSEADPHIIANSKLLASEVDMRGRSIEMNQTALISLQCISISKSVETKTLGSCQSLLAQPSVRISGSASRPNRPARPVPRTKLVARFGKAVFRSTIQKPQELFWTNMTFF